MADAFVNSAVESKCARVRVCIHDAQKVQALEPRLQGKLSPTVGELEWVPKLVRTKDNEERFPLDRDVAVVGKRIAHGVEVILVVGAPWIRLVDEKLPRSADPGRGPTMVGPSQAEREVGLAAPKHLIERALEQSAASEPVVPVAKPLDAMRARQLCLCFARLRGAKVVIAELDGDSRLVVTLKERPRAAAL